MFIPRGVLWIKWSDQLGVSVDWQYPDTFVIDHTEVLAIYTSQTMGDTLNPRFTTLSSNDLKIATFYGGETHKDMVVLMLDQEEDPRDFRDSLTDLYYRVIQGKIDRADVEEKFETLFDIVQAHHATNQARFDILEARFETLLNVFRGYADVMRSRFKAVENGIIVLRRTLSDKIDIALTPIHGEREREGKEDPPAGE